MRLESVEINNYRQYQRATFTFPKLNGKSDLHIIYGSNTVGKSNMLNAITWCLYERELHLGDKNTAQPMINNSYVSHLRSINQNNGEVSVILTISSDDGKRKMKVERVASFNVTADTVKEIDDKVTVSNYDNNQWSIIENQEEALINIHRYLPEEINEYIFFDGEQLEKYFQEVQTNKNIKAIKGFTQSDIIEKAIRGFNKAKSEISLKLTNMGDNELKDKEADLKAKEDACKQLEDIIKELKTQIGQAKDKIAELDEIIRGKETIRDKTQRYQELQDEAEQLEEEKKSLFSDMMKFARKYYTLLALYPALKAYKEYIDKQDVDGKLPPIIDKDILDRIVKDGKCLICGNELDEKHIAFVRELQRKINMSSKTSNEMKAALGALRGYFQEIDGYKEEKAKKVQSYESLQKRIKDNENEYSKLDEYLKSIPNNSEIAEAISNREKYQELLNALYERKGKEEYSFQIAEEKREEADKEYRKAVAKHEELRGISAQMEYCTKASTVLEKTEENILAGFRNDMEKQTYDLFNSLTWAKGKYIAINLGKDYSVKLLNKFGDQALGSCSAAERTLLALSFTLALQKSSHHDSLLFIDTPVGRIDEENRKNFSKVLLDLAKSKQVILTFTPTEYDADVRGVLEGNYSSFQELIQNDFITEVKTK